MNATESMPRLAATCAIFSGLAPTLSLSMLRALAMSKFWQKRQPELQPAVPKLSTLEPGWKWLRGFFSIAGLDGNCLWLPQHRHLDIQQWVFRSGDRVETWVTGGGIHRMGDHILAKWLMGNQRAPMQPRTNVIPPSLSVVYLGISPSKRR